MPRSSDSSTAIATAGLLNGLAPRLRRALQIKDPRVLVRLILGLLLLGNVAAALILFKPWGGSAEDLERQMSGLRQQVVQRQAMLGRTKALVEKAEKARQEGDKFLDRYVLNRRTAFSTLVAELDRAAVQSGIKSKEKSFQVEPIEGSDTLSMMTVSAGYEANYASLTRYINLLDRSQRFLVIESMQASPQQTGNVLNVNIKLNTFVREGPEGAPLPPSRPVVSAPAAPPVKALPPPGTVTAAPVAANVPRSAR